MKKAADTLNNTMPQVGVAAKRLVLSIADLGFTLVYSTSKAIADAAQRGQLFVLEHTNKDNNFMENREVITYAGAMSNPIYENDIEKLEKAGVLLKEDQNREIEKRNTKAKLVYNTGIPDVYANLKVDAEW